MIGRRRSWPRNPVRHRWVVIAAVVLLAATLLWSQYERLARLLTPPTSGVRSIEPRLSGGSAWVPFGKAKARRDPRQEGVYARVVDTAGPTMRGEPDLTPVAQHDTGVTLLLAGRTQQALAALTAAAETSNEPAAWNDLSVAYHEAAIRYDKPELLADALTAADRALSLDPRYAEALFNRALMIERFGLKSDARAAWIGYLAIDPQSGWGDEARAHLGALKVEKPFLESLDGEYELVAANRAVAESLAGRDPYRARALGIMCVLGRWGEEMSRGDTNKAALHLRVARQLGAAIALGGKDHTLERAVATIDASDDRTRAILAAAHADYKAGLHIFQDGRPLEAEPVLRRAAAGFEQANSPMVLPALMFAANTVYEQGRHDEAEQQIEQLLARTPEEFPAYRGMMTWELGICHRSRADWGAAITYFEESIALFERLGETQNVATGRRMLALIYDRIGDPDTAWTHRVAALRDGHGVGSGQVQEKTVSSIAEAALLRQQWHTAASFLALHAASARRMRSDLELAETLLLCAVVRDRLEDRSGAQNDLAEAKLAAARVTDPGSRSSLRVAELRAAATLSTTPPAQADALLTEAIRLRTTESDPASLPALLLLRAKVRRQGGNGSGAMEDVARGIEELERNRESLPEGEARWGAFHGAEELFEQGIELAMARGDDSAAFRFAESARARALLDAYGRSPILDPDALPERTVVVEYASLPSRLVIFTAHRTGVRAVSVACTRETLVKEANTLVRTIRAEEVAAANEVAAVVYRRLIAPVAAQIAEGETIVFVPDSATSIIPFAALTDEGGGYLLHRHASMTAPSASLFVAAAERRRDSGRPATALLIAAPEATEEMGALQDVDVEMKRIATAYRHVTSVGKGMSQLDELRRHAQDADVIHFAGHAVGDDCGFQPASIFLRQNGRERRVGVAEIAKLQVGRSATVVLAGCSTARGESRAAEGVISVAHGFLSAGAPSVIATLWPIADSSSATFFPRLHRYLADGFSPAEAVRAAQIESIRKGDVPASVWAAVQDIGS
jgi:CHAT domain-containing protein